MEERSLFRIGAFFGIAGTVLGVAFNLAHPRTFDDFSTEASLELIATSGAWVGIHLALVAAVLFSILGLGALSRSIGGGAGSAFARLGFVAALIGGAVLIANLALDGVAAKFAADNWAASSGSAQEAAFAVAAPIVQTSFGMFATVVGAFFGITFVLFGLAVALGEGYPKWLGWVALVAGAGGIVVGSFMAYDGQGTNFTNVAFIPVSLLGTVWLLVMSILLWQKGAPSPAQSP